MFGFVSNENTKWAHPKILTRYPPNGPKRSTGGPGRSRTTFLNFDRISTGPKAKRLHLVQICRLNLVYSKILVPDTHMAPQVHRRSRRTFVNFDRIRTGPNAKTLHLVKICRLNLARPKILPRDPVR